MLRKLNDLVFGFAEFEKTKFELRFSLISNIIPSIKLENLNDFDLLEKIIYKINELLRLKSSNLNKAIRDPANRLRKKDVLLVLDSLNKIKYEYLNNSKKNLEKVSSVQSSSTTINNSNNNISNNTKDVNISNLNNFKEKDNSLNSKNLNTNISSENVLDVNADKILFFENDLYSVYLENQVVPFVLINFKEDFDLIVINKVSNIFFENMVMHATNIIIQDNKCLIIPRFNEDNLFHLPVLDKPDIKNTFRIIQEIMLSKADDFKDLSSKKSTQISDEDGLFSSNINLKEKSDNLVNNDYIKVVEKKEFSSLKGKEDSLDSLLEKQIDSKDHVDLDHNSKPDLVSDKEKEEKINFIVNPEENKISVEKKHEIKENQENPNDKIEIISNNNNNNISDFVFYSDDNLVAYLNENSKVLGEIYISSKLGKKLSELDSSDLTYMSIFSKVFSSVLFESLKLAGTNLIWDYDGDVIRIIPRFENDGFNNLFLTGKQESNDFLEQIKDKLLLAMKNELVDEKENLSTINNNSNNVEQNKDVVSKEDDDSNLLEEKAKYILESLKRIP